MKINKESMKLVGYSFFISVGITSLMFYVIFGSMLLSNSFLIIFFIANILGNMLLLMYLFKKLNKSQRGNNHGLYC